MSKTIERFQNPCVGDTVILRLLTYNSNSLTDPHSVEKVEIFQMEDNGEKRLVEVIDANNITRDDTGKYHIRVVLEDQKYLIGKLIDVWHVTTYEFQPSHKITQYFDVYSNLWYSSPVPMVYDFNFMFQPNRMRKGSKQYIMIEVIPNVPSAGDLRRYYENLAIVSNLKVSLELKCGECTPQEQDLRVFFEDEPVSYREKRFGYFQIDTQDMDCGTYDISFTLEVGENVYKSDKMAFQIYQ